MKQDDFVPNERLRRARSLKGWSQAELARQVGTSFEMVSRWERGVTIPSHYYRERLCAVLDKTAGELGLTLDGNGTNALPPTSLVFLASSHVDSEKEVFSYLKSSIQDRGFTLWNSRQIGRQAGVNSKTALREAIRAAQVILVIISPEAHSSRHVRETLELASRYLRPVYGVWIEGENWRECLPKGSEELAVLIDAREKDATALFEEVATVLKRMELVSAGVDRSTSARPVTQIPVNAPDPLLTVLPLPTLPAIPVHRKDLSRTRVEMLVGLTFLVIIGGVLGSFGLHAHFGVLGARSTTVAVNPVRGGTWSVALSQDPDSFIPNHSNSGASAQIIQALYLPLFYGDKRGQIYAGSAAEIPTVQNGGVSIDTRVWTFHLRPHLVWSDGQPYDARDVDYTWKLWLNPKFNTINTVGLNLITRADVSADYLSITFHLTQPFAPFLASLWVDGFLAPLPAHHFSRIAPEAITTSPDNLHPQVVSGPFMMDESVPGDHYALVRNPHYYRASEGLPYLDKVVFHIVSQNGLLDGLQVGSIDSSSFLYEQNPQQYLHMTNYTVVKSPTSANFEALWFNFNNTVLANHPEVREAIAKAIDRQALIAAAPQGLASPLCTDHGTAFHPGYDVDTACPLFDSVVVNKLLDDHGWIKGHDGVRTRDKQRLEFEYSTSVIFAPLARFAVEAIVQRNVQAIGIKLDIQNYDNITFFGRFLPTGQASPPTGAVTGRYDIAEYNTGLGYDPDDSGLLACDQFPPKGGNYDFYCNPTLDALYQLEKSVTDPGIRQQIFFHIHQLYSTDFPFIVLYSTSNFGLARKGTHNYQPSPFEGDTVNLWEWWCDNGKC